jgi:hypothetical protein
MKPRSFIAKVRPTGTKLPCSLLVEHEGGAIALPKAALALAAAGLAT